MGGMNRLKSLPRGFGSFPLLEVMDLSYNMLNENSLPENFFMLHTLRALYLSDNEFELLSPKIGNLINLRILAIRDNELIEVPEEIGFLTFERITFTRKSIDCFATSNGSIRFFEFKTNFEVGQ